jgi:hypothetical protein
MAAAARTRATSPTEVPPNFITIIAPVLRRFRFVAKKEAGALSAPACRSVL